MGNVKHIPEVKTSDEVFSMKICAPTKPFRPLNNSLEEQYCYRASCLMCDGRFAESREVYEEATALGFKKAANLFATALDCGWFGYEDTVLASAIYQDLAYKRYPIAMYNYGMMIALGRGVRKNPKRAEMWIDRAADAGLDIAMTAKAVRLAFQTEVPDYKTAFELFMRAAECGDETAMYNVGYFYLTGKHVEQNYEKAVFWLQKAVDFGDGCFPELHLARCYHAGKGVTKDEDKAKELMSQAIEHGLPKNFYPKWWITLMVNQ